MKWYRKAAEQGHAVSQFNLGLMYENGAYGETNKWMAIKLFQKASKITSRQNRQYNNFYEKNVGNKRSSGILTGEPGWCGVEFGMKGRAHGIGGGWDVKSKLK